MIILPTELFLVSTSHLNKMISDMLIKLISHNDKIPITQSNLTRFHSRAAPAISLLEYLERIVKYAGVENVVLISILVYIDRICEKNPSFMISSLTVHRFIITAITISSKSFCDIFLTNSTYGKIGGISTQELNILELEFLFLISWNLNSNFETFQTYYVNLVKQVLEIFIIVAS